MAYNQPLRGFPYVVIPFDISPSTAGDTEIKAVVANKHLVVAGLLLVTHGDVVAAFYSEDSSTGGNSISGALTGTQIHGVVERDLEYGLFWTKKGEALILNLDANVRCSGRVLVVEANDMPPIVEI
jgi:hypothetical protein